jgi:hypothetical protein
MGIVGGTIRDLLSGKAFDQINDVDIAISRPYTWTSWALTDFFDLESAIVGPRYIVTID